MHVKHKKYRQNTRKQVSQTHQTDSDVPPVIQSGDVTETSNHAIDSLTGFAYSGGQTHLSGIEGRVARLIEKVQALIFKTSFYRMTLWYPFSVTMKQAPATVWYGDQEIGQAILANRYCFAGSDIHCDQAPWVIVSPSPEFFAHLHSFTWLVDLNMIGGDTARYKARELTADWISHYGVWSDLSWRPDVLARRLLAWFSHYQIFFASADAFFQKQLASASQQQLRHLARLTPGTLTGLDLLVVIKALCLGSMCLTNQARLFEKSVTLLDDWIHVHVLADGGYLERSPHSQALALKDLIDIKVYLQKMKGDLPVTLQNAIDRMAPVLRFYRMGDGDLAHFNDSRELGAPQVRDILTRADARGKAPVSLPHTGFERVVSGKTILLMDIGQPAPEGYDGRAAAGILSFEMSYGVHRFIINCGSPLECQNWGHPAIQIYQDSQKKKYYCRESSTRQVWRATAAHSTLTLNDTNSTEIYKFGGVGRRPKKVTCERINRDNCVLLEASQDGYIPLYGLTHYRHLFVGQDGEDIRGEDRLCLEAGEQMSEDLANFMRRNAIYSKHGLPSWPFDIRFHLHPFVKLRTQQGDQLSLQLPDSSIWQFRQSGGDLHLAESAYYDGKGYCHKTWQIRITGKTVQYHESLTFAKVKWAFQKRSS